MTKWFPFLRGSEFEVGPERQEYALRARKGCLGRSNSPMPRHLSRSVGDVGGRGRRVGRVGSGSVDL